MQTRSQNIRLSSTEFSPSSTPSTQTRSKNKRVIAQSNESTKESIKESRPSPYKLRKLTAVCYSEMDSDSESESEVEVEAFEGTRRRNPSLAVRIPSRPPATPFGVYGGLQTTVMCSPPARAKRNSLKMYKNGWSPIRNSKK